MFEAQQKLLFRHCDPAGIVFFPRYFEMMNDCIEAFFDHCLKYLFEQFLQTAGIPTATITTAFNRPIHRGEVVAGCPTRSTVGGERFAVDASLIRADVQKQDPSNPDDWPARETDPNTAPRAIRAYFDTHADPASQWITARKGPGFFTYSTNYLIDTDHSVSVDVEATQSIRQAEVGSVRTVLERVKDTFELDPERIIVDTAYGSGPMLGWLVDRKIAPHIPVIDKAGCTEGT